MTNDLVRRIYEHKNGLVEGFAKKYNCHKLVWYQATCDVNSAIAQEKRMKKWKREFKENIIETMNPSGRDLSNDFL
jgi:putative endonuclease